MSLTSTAPGAEIAAWWGVVDLCFPGHAACGAATFRPAGPETLEADWSDWVEFCYRPVLRPAVFALHEAALASSWSRLRAAERALALALPEPARAGSLAAGRRSLLGFAPPRGAKLLDRWRAENDISTGHAAAVFVVRAQLFHLPSVQIAASLALAECLLGASSVGHVPRAETVAALLGGAIAGGAGTPAWATV